MEAGEVVIVFLLGVFVGAVLGVIAGALVVVW
jgi:hypothetical protein